MRLPRFLAAALLSPVLTLACAREDGEAPSGAASSASLAAPAPSASPASRAPADKAPPSAASAGSASPLAAPEGYFLAKVEEVAPTPAGHRVLLAEDEGERLLPIFVGGTEALAIELRHDKKRFQRPLTHDLLDAVLERLGGELVKVHVDELRGSTFVGRVYLRKDGALHDLDARPSDAIALALGRDAPIFVAGAVLDASGLRRGDLEKGTPFEPPRGIRPPEPLAL